MRRGAAAFALAAGLAGLLGLGCVSAGGDAFGGDQGLQEVQRRYTRLVRWSEFDRASDYVLPEARDAFLDRAAALRDVRFTEYRVRSSDLDLAPGEAQVRIEYRAYRTNSPIETIFDETQHWVQDPETGAWRVRPSLVERGITVGGAPPG